MGLLERYRIPWSKALREAGPRDLHVLLALIAGGVVDVVLVIATRDSMPFVAYVMPPFLLSLVVSGADRDGPVIRAAMAYVGLEQLRRATSGSRLPITPSAADRWLDEPHPEASALERASVLLTAGRLADAKAAADAFEPASTLDRVRQLRMRASVAAAMSPTADLDIDSIRAAAAPLPDEERRYHVVSAA